MLLELKERVESIDNLIEQQLADLVTGDASCKGKKLGKGKLIVTCQFVKTLKNVPRN